MILGNVEVKKNARCLFDGRVVDAVLYRNGARSGRIIYYHNGEFVCFANGGKSWAHAKKMWKYFAENGGG